MKKVWQLFTIDTFFIAGEDESKDFLVPFVFSEYATEEEAIENVERHMVLFPRAEIIILPKYTKESQ